jgi:hypothetical protein
LKDFGSILVLRISSYQYLVKTSSTEKNVEVVRHYWILGLKRLKL